MEYDYEKMNRDLDIAKTKVFMRPDAAFFGPIMCSLYFQWSDEIETAASNPDNFWWNPEDFLRCQQTSGMVEGTIMHELWHVARLHDLRRGERCPDIWNIACDIWINRELKRDKWYAEPPWFIQAPMYDKINTEEDIYEKLKQNGQPQAGNCSHAHAPSQGTKQQQIATVVKAIQAAKMANSPGSIPGNTEQIVDKFLTPIIPWEQHLYQWMADLADEDFTWARPNRRYLEL